MIDQAITDAEQRLVAGVLNGAPKDFAQYQNTVGQYQGLQIARRALDAVNEKLRT
jgi:uncharacterized membrane protein (UPF0136 family)